MELLDSYPYLGWCVLMLLVSAFAALSCPRKQRLPMMLSSALTVPVGMFAFLCVPDYWDPVQVVRWHAGPEDILFGLANGTTVWVLATRLLGRPLEVRLQPIRLVRRYLLLLVTGLLLYLSLSGLGMRTMDATLLVIAATATVLLTWYAHLRRVALLTALSFAVAYAALTIVAVQLWPHFADQWNHGRLWGVAVGGVPLEEFVWALAFGATWPLIVAHVTDAHLGVTRGPVRGPHRVRLTGPSAKAGQLRGELLKESAKT